VTVGPGRRRRILARSSGNHEGTGLGPDRGCGIEQSIFKATPLAGLALALSLAAPTFAQQPPEPPPDLKRDVFRVDTEVVLLDVVVRDKKGRTVPDLRPEEVEVYEDDVRQQLDGFRFLDSKAAGETVEAIRETSEEARPAQPPPESRHLNLVTILFDRLGPDGRAIARKAAQSFIEMEDRPDVYVSVFQIVESLKLLQQFTTDREVVKHAVLRATGDFNTQYTAATEDLVEATRRADDLRQVANPFMLGGSNSSGGSVTSAQLGQELAMADMTVNALRLTETLQREQQGRSALFAVLALARQQQALAGRKTILFFSEGLQTPPTLEHVLRAAISEANRANVSVYAVDARGLSTVSNLAAARDTLEQAVTTSMQQQMTRGYLPVTREEATIADNAEAAIRMDPIGTLGDLATSTGGLLIANTNDVRAGVARAVGDLRGYYEFAYSPSNREFDGKFRRIALKVKRPGVTVQTRSGYFAMPRGEGTATFPYEVDLLRAMRASSPPHDFPLRARAFRFGHEEAGTRYTMVLEFPLDSIQFLDDQDPSLQRAHFSFMGVLRDSSGAVVEKFSQDSPVWVPRRQEAALRSGNAVFMRSFTLPSGRYSLEAAAADQQTGHKSVELSRLLVADATPPLALSNLAVVKRTEPVAKGALPSDDPFRLGNVRVVPWVSEAEVGAGEELKLFLVAYASGDVDDPASLSLEFVRGAHVVGQATPDLPHPDAKGRIPYLLTLPATRFPPGLYEVRAELKKGARRAWESCSFRVVGPHS
jgi:VWFA-related protein